jgi:CheY-like chemotaxis protein
MTVLKTSEAADSQNFDEAIEEASTSVISGRLHDFFAEQGLLRHKHASQLAVILGLSRSGAFRKFQDGSFSASDLQTIAHHFQVDVSLLLSAQSVEVARAEPEMRPARIYFGARPMLCKAHIGTVLGPNDHCELVATQQGTEWLVQPYAAASANAPRHRVLQLSITPVQRQLPRLAVLEDSHDLAANLKEAFEGAGFRVEVFASAVELSRRAAVLPFDAYVADWWLDGQTAATVLQSIRKAQPTAPLILTTGAIANGHALEDDIVRIAVALRIHVIEKPFRLALLISQVNQLIEETAQTAT